MNIHRRLLSFAGSAGLFLPMAMFFGILAGGLTILQSSFLSKVIAGVFIDQLNLQDVAPFLWVILAVVLFRTVFSFLNEYLAGRLSINIKVKLRELLLAKIDRLGPAFVRSEKTGELTTAAMQGVESLDAYFSQYLPQILIAVILPLAILIVVFPMDLLTGIIFLLTAPLIPVFMRLIGWASEAVTKRQWQALSRLGNYFLDTLQGIATLKALGRSKERVQQVWSASDQYRRTTLSILKVTFLSALVLELVATLSTAVVAVEIGLRLLYSRIEFQQAFFILLIAPEFYAPLRNLSARFHAGMAGITAASRIFEVLDLPEKEHGKHFNQATTTPFNGEFVLEARNLSYSYPGNPVNSVQNINFHLESGKHYALVGASGAGKTTVAQLLLRLIEPEQGSIFVNDQEMYHWSVSTWRARMAWVPQKPAIFNSTVFENLTLGDQSYSISQIDQAVKMAGLTSVVSGLRDGYETNLLEAGARLSGGELQRIAIARAILRNPRFLILDEPTSSLDINNEKLLSESLKQLMQGRTTLTIAHRLSTIQNADQIILMDKGRLVDTGNHKELLSRNPLYTHLVSAGRTA